MNIIIVGAGKIGTAIAKHLAKENNNITIIDKNPTIINRIVEIIDCIGIVGNGSSATVLLNANVKSADLIIATTTSDELNMLCCLLAKKLGIGKAIARVRNPEFNDEAFLLNSQLDIDLVINPELETATEIARLLKFQDALHIDTFFNGKIELVAVKINGNNSLINKKILEVFYNKNSKVLLSIIDRNQQVIIPKGNTVLLENDVIYIIGKITDVYNFLKKYKFNSNKIKDIMIVGGSKIAYYLAKTLEKSQKQVKLIESNKARCIELNESLHKTIIINADGSNEQNLIFENIGKMDAFISLTGRDEENIIMALYAVQQQVPKVIAKANQINFSVIQKLGIDSIVTPKNITAYQVLRYVRALKNSLGNNVVTLYKLVNAQAEALEFNVTSSANCIGILLKELKLKDDILITTIIRNEAIIIPTGNDKILAGDRIIVITKLSNIYDVNDIVRN